MGNTSKRYPVEVRERAVRLVLEHRGEYETKWAAISSVAGKIGCSAETLRGWVRQAEIDRVGFGAPGDAGSNVTAKPSAPTAVHCCATGHATLTRSTPR